MKLKNQFHHNSIDETSLNDSQDNENEVENLDEENNRRLINSDMQLNNQNLNLNHLKMSHLNNYQDMSNQKRTTGKLMNMRQSPRFSPAAASSPSSIPLQSTLISKSQTSLNSNVIIPTSLSQANNISNNFDQSQLHHHHHHHHHFHHHFHNKNEIESQQQHQNTTTNIMDPSQSVFLR